MKILVAVKRVVDYAVKIRVKSDGSGIELGNDEIPSLSQVEALPCLSAIIQDAFSPRQEVSDACR